VIISPQNKEVGMSDIVYFELNNWMPSEDYPDEEPFISWVGNNRNNSTTFYDKIWVKQNKLCIVADFIDMSVNFCVTATKEWVLENCPKLLTDYKDFLRYPNEDGLVEGRFETRFLEYSEENFGIIFRDEDDKEDYDWEYEDEGVINNKVWINI
jgi:hypothetical protein